MQSLSLEERELALLRKKQRVLIICGAFMSLLAAWLHLDWGELLPSTQLAATAAAGGALYAMSFADWLGRRVRLKSGAQGGGWIRGVIYVLYTGLLAGLLAAVIALVYSPDKADALDWRGLTSGMTAGVVYYVFCHLMAALADALAFGR